MATPATAAQLDAHLITTDLKHVRVQDLLGQPLVLAFFPAAFTSVCTTEMCTLRDSMARFNTLNAKVYGISVDLPYALQAFGEKNNLSFPLLSDMEREAIRAFDVVWPLLGGVVKEVASRAVFVLDAEGNIVYRWVGNSPANEPPYSEVTRAVESLTT
ncbi:MAG TPA: redoxin domain-containing protein [Chloroflexota bacterium]|nr:redoxin domain-containing protein [Chloroflexota bacterium]